VNKGLITPVMQEKVHSMRGFRNIVVHRYGAIDDTLAFHLLQENTVVFFLFTAEIKKILEKPRNPQKNILVGSLGRRHPAVLRTCDIRN